MVVEQTLDTATQANLIGVTLCTNRPAHPAVPATAQDHDANTRQSCGQQAQRPKPARLLILLTHLPQPVSPYNFIGYAQFQNCAITFGTACSGTTCLPKSIAAIPPLVLTPLLRMGLNICNLRIMRHLKARNSRNKFCENGRGGPGQKPLAVP